MSLPASSVPTQSAPKSPLNAKGLTREALRELLRPWGVSELHLKTFMARIYRDQVRTPQELPLSRRRFKLDSFPLGFECLEASEAVMSQDGSIKYRIARGERSIETVWIPKGQRVTVCVSSQVGCSLDCQFCLTARLKLARNLEAWEIVDQVLLAQRSQPTRPVSNVVFMGMGEPFMNFEAVRSAVHVLTDPWGLGLAPNKVTVSTSGHIPGILRWAKEGRTSLAVSLITIDADLRSELMSINKRYPLSDLLEAIAFYNVQTGKKVFVEYILMRDLTDKLEDARELALKLKDCKVTVNLIPYNENAVLPYKRPPLERVLEFRNELRRQGVFATLRWSQGGDVSAACGQLASL